MTNPTPIQSLLIANRGEIAVRIIRACKELGIRTISVHSEVDAGALWTRLSDETVYIGPAAARESYLSIEALIAAAKGSGADAVHPGYGLLSESSEFAQAVVDAGLIFVGPSASVIAIMGDKVSARNAARGAGLPILPGSDGAIEDRSVALAVAEGIGWPIAVKASFGGGGRGMRVARQAPDLTAAMDQASREARAAFGRADIYLERYLDRPRHVEVQILADGHGGVVHLGDRDCSVQRRHQKLIEEAPAPALPEGLRNRISEAAVRLAAKVGYESAGTVEFLADVANDSFYFLEMNTRLQVEHGVTELVTGVDIVRAQIAVAEGRPLAFSQADVVVRGHAVQARIAAEDAWDGFRPAPGRIEKLGLPLGPWLRLDFGVETGDQVSGSYDSMFGKVQAYGQTRDEAVGRLANALDALVVAGVPTTAPYIRTLLDQPAFLAVEHDTGSLERDWLPRQDQRPEPVVAEPNEETVMNHRSERQVLVPWGGQLVGVSVFGQARSAQAASARSGEMLRGGNLSGATSDGPDLLAPMDAAVAFVSVEVGASVSRGDPVVVLEAMKMEVVVAAPYDGTLSAIDVGAGDAVKLGQRLAVIARAS
ncbi:acetyl/propionyl/methylcrotonyl-CoA carboxylase subunit alpha [soil metagenome]